MEGGKEKAVEPILITFSGKDIDRIYWRFFWNSVMLSILISVGGFLLMAFIAIASMKYENRPSRPTVEPTTSNIEAQPTPQISEPTPAATTSPSVPALSAEQSANCVEKMQSGQIEAYNECVKNK
jgi:hypothetical protein